MFRCQSIQLISVSSRLPVTAMGASRLHISSICTVPREFPRSGQAAPACRRSKLGFMGCSCSVAKAFSLLRSVPDCRSQLWALPDCTFLLSVLYLASLRGAGLRVGSACPLRGDLRNTSDITNSELPPEVCRRQKVYNEKGFQIYYGIFKGSR